MEVINVNDAKSFVTKANSEIREILAPRNSSPANQSLAEAKLLLGRCTQEHFHPKAEEICFILQGKGKMRVEDETRDVRASDGVVILPGQKHKI